MRWVRWVWNFYVQLQQTRIVSVKSTWVVCYLKTEQCWINLFQNVTRAIHELIVRLCKHLTFNISLFHKQFSLKSKRNSNLLRLSKVFKSSHLCVAMFPSSTRHLPTLLNFSALILFAFSLLWGFACSKKGTPDALLSSKSLILRSTRSTQNVAGFWILGFWIVCMSCRIQPRVRPWRKEKILDFWIYFLWANKTKQYTHIPGRWEEGKRWKFSS